MILRIASAALLFLLAAPSASAQLTETAADPFRTYGDTIAVRYRVGASIEATKGPVRDIVAMVAVPFECDEQEVIVADEDISAEIGSVDYRMVNGGARQMVITIPYLPGGTEAHAILTFEVRTKVILPPEEELTAQLVPPKKPDRELKRYLGRSPYIQHNHGKIRRTLKDIFSPKAEADEEVEATDEETDSVELTATQSASDEERVPAEPAPTDEATTEEAEPAADPATLTTWQRVEKIYDYVQGSIEYVEGEDQSAVETLDRGKGDCHDVSALFVALCRADKIPARMVWVHEHQYPEFCLADAEGKLHWFPSESSGMRAFGEMPTARVIMQKGDNFQVPERPRDALRYASDYLIGLPVDGSGKPKVRYIREML
ncbi:MAG: transglutaminase domain-containing protein [Bythopirellula sp.]|nr:transglutaminase domain-containing protein [Bythopirellula sp.]